LRGCIVGLVLLILIILLVAGLPTWPYGRAAGYGYWPSGILGVVLLVLLVLLLFNVLPWGFGPYPH
jgi:hypothetical protein